MVSSDDVIGSGSNFLGGLLSNIFEFGKNNLGNLLQGGVGAYGYAQLMDQFKESQNALPGQLSAIRGDILDKGSFQPWTVRSSAGNAAYNPETGAMDYTLSAGQQDFSDMSRTGSTQMWNRATMDPTQRETDVYNRIRAMQQPDEQRAYETMNANLFSGGRGGMMSGQYGGSPEQFAFGKAQAEARNAASLAAMQQAQTEMTNYGNIATALGQQQYLPYENLRNMTGQGIQNAQLRQQAGANLANQLATLGLGGITADVNWGNVYGGAFGALMEALGTTLGNIG